MASLSFISPIMATYIIDNFSSSTSIVGLLFLIISMSYVLTAPFIGYLSKNKEKGYIMIGCLLETIGFIMISFKTIYVFIAGLVLLGVGGNFMMLPYFVYLQQKTNLSNDKASAIVNASFNFGEILGSLISGVLVEFISIDISFIVWAITIFLLVFIIYFN